MAAKRRPDKWEITWDEYKELDYFCRQYARKKQEADALLTLRVSTPAPVTTSDGSGVFIPHGGTTSDPVSATAEKREKLLRDVDMIDRAAGQAGGELAPYLLRAVTRRDGLRRILVDCPCSERSFYRMRRRFFFILRELKNGNPL